jgi:hypothetical protein
MKPRAGDGLRRIAAALMLAATCGSAWAGPPFVTDDPEPVDHRRWEVNYAFAAIWGNGDVSAGVPSVDINYGVAPNVQLHAQPRYSYEKSGDEVHSGVDDTEIGVKYRFVDIENEGSRLMVGIYPLYQVATGARALGPDRGKHQIFLPLWLQHSTERWSIYGGWGYRMNPAEGNKDSVFTGATVLYGVSEGLHFGGELFHETPDTPGGKSLNGVNLGAIVQIARDYNLLFSAGQRTSVDVAHSLYLALQAHY